MSSFDDSVDKLTIGKFSSMTKLSPKSLRIYDANGLLSPSIKDPINKYRYYTLDQIEIGIKINMLKTMGFRTNEISKILDAASDGDLSVLNSLFNSRLQNIKIEVERLKKLEEILKDKKPMELLYMQCSTPEVKKISKLRIISKRELGNYSITIGKIIGELMEEIFSTNNQKAGVTITGPIFLLAHDKEYKEEDADIEIGIPISGRINLQSPEIEVKNLNETSVVSVIFTGPYHEIGIGYAKAHEYLLSKGLKISAPTREIYLNDPNKVVQDQLLTEIQIPIK